MVNLKAILSSLYKQQTSNIGNHHHNCFLNIRHNDRYVSDFLVPQTTSVWGISFFIVYQSYLLLSQYLLLRFVWLKTKDIRSKSFLFNGLLKIIIASQYTLLAILIVIIYQILFMSQYYTAFLIWSTVISFLLTIMLLGILARKFFFWYRYYKRDSIIILSYALAFVIMSMTFSLALILDLYSFSNKQGIVTPISEVAFPNFDKLIG